MKHKQIADPDMEVIGLVNDGVAGRRRVAETRKILKEMHQEQAKARKADWWREFRSMVIEAGTFAVGGIAVLFAMGRGLVDPVAGVPVVLLCMIWTAIRVDRFARR